MKSGEIGNQIRWIFGYCILKSAKINWRPPKSINIYIIPPKSPAKIEITWGHCPRVPKENGGLSNGTNSDSDDASATKAALDETMNDDVLPMVVKSEKPAAKTAPAKPAHKAAAKKEEPSPDEDSSYEEEKPAAKVADKKEESSSEESSDEEVAVWEVSKPIKSNPEKHAAKPATKAAKKEESSDRDRSNSDGEPAPNEADQAQWQPAKQPKDNQPPAKNVSTAAMSWHQRPSTQQRRMS